MSGPQEHETETDFVRDDEYSALFKITPKHRHRLFVGANIRLAALLRDEDRPRYEALLYALDVAGIKGLREFTTAVDRKVKEVERAVRSAAIADGDGAGETQRELAKRFRDEKHPTLLRYQGDWLLHRGSFYEAVDEVCIKDDLWAFMDAPGVTNRDASETLAALKGVVHVERGRYSPPCWLPGHEEKEKLYPAREIMACDNGLLHIPSGTLLDPTPAFFTRVGLPFAYDPLAPAPAAWLGFLDEVWGHDAEQITLLQEMFGLLLTPDTSMQKFFYLYGVSRGGKGVILRTAESLVGKRNVCSPKLDDLGGRFGLEATLGKTLAIVADMRLGAKSNKQTITENLLRLTGEDSVSIERKHIGERVEGKPDVRLLIASNKILTLPDESRALVNRLVGFEFTVSFKGREDPTLPDRIAATELPGILNWAVDGWRRLKAQGRFTVTAASTRVSQRTAEVASPMEAFLDECCEFDPDATELKQDVWHAFQLWAIDLDVSGVAKTSTYFHPALETAAQMRIRPVRREDGNGERQQMWAGMRLKPEWKEKASQWT